MVVSLGASDVAAPARRLEETGRAGELAEAKDQLAALEREMDRLGSELEALALDEEQGASP